MAAVAIHGGAAEPAGESPVENWDDDIDFEGDLFSGSVSTAITPSRLSVKSESNTAADESYHVHIALDEDDHAAVPHAITSLKQVGIPVPDNIMPSALLGSGSIRRLGRKKSRQCVTDDWDGDLELPQGAVLGRPRVAPWPEAVDDGIADIGLGLSGLGFNAIPGPTGGPAPDGRRTPALSAATGPLADSDDDDGFDGIELPTESVDFVAMLKTRRTGPSTPTQFDSSPRLVAGGMHVGADQDDFFEGLSVGPDGLMGQNRPTAVNANVQVQRARLPAPTAARKPMATITFSDRLPLSRLPRPTPVANPKSSALAPVHESRLPVPRPAVSAPTTRAQLLRTKRSAPLLRGSGPSIRHSSLAHPMPALASQLSAMRQPMHVRRESDPHRPVSPAVRPASRQATGHVRQTFSRPTRARNFGDGTELDEFDDLPTSVVKESKFVRPVASRGPGARPLRSMPSRSALPTRVPEPDASPVAVRSGPAPQTGGIPRFARDTASSRIAREQRLASSRIKPEPVPTNWRATVAARSATPKKPTAPGSARKPFLIKGVGPVVTRVESGMTYNPNSHRWEGNENALNAFEPIAPVPFHSLPRRAIRPSASNRDMSARFLSTAPSRSPLQSLSVANLHAAAAAAAAATPRPALISPLHYGAGRAAKAPPMLGQRPKHAAGGGSEMVWDALATKWVNKTGIEDDPFADIADLEDERSGIGAGPARQAMSPPPMPAQMGFQRITGGPEGSLPGFVPAGRSVPFFGPVQLEEFDPGPDFINRLEWEERNWAFITNRWDPEPELTRASLAVRPPPSTVDALHEGRVRRELLLRDWRDQWSGEAEGMRW